MKNSKPIVFTLWLCLTSSFLIAQYIPLVVDSATWNISTNEDIGFLRLKHGYSLTIKRDTVINTQSYKLLQLERDWAQVQRLTLPPTPPTVDNRTYNLGYIGALREDSVQKKVYFYPFYRDFMYIDPFSNQQVQLMQYDSAIVSSNGELLWYNFDVAIGDTLDFTGHYSTTGNRILLVDHIDSIQLRNGRYYRRLNFEVNSLARPWIEGIGSIDGLLFPQGTDNLATNAGQHNLNCYDRNGFKLYLFNSPSVNCDSTFILSVPRPSQVSPIQLAIHPNPVSDLFVVEIEGMGYSNELVTLKIFNSVGKEVYHLATASAIETIHVDAIGPKGVYFIQLLKGHQVVARSTFVRME